LGGVGGGGPGARPAVKLLVSNVHNLNRDHRRVTRLVEAEAPDVVGLVEVTSRWLGGLWRLRLRYAYYFESPDELYGGLALYSRFPIVNARILALPEAPSTPAIAATLEAPGGDVEIILAHPYSPADAGFIRQRNEQIRALAAYAAGVRGPLVMAGDFNLTMWNAGYRPLVETAGLHNARQGYGVGPSWPALGPLGVPIDHIFGTPGVHFRNFRVLGPVGSDHLPVWAEFTAR
jgi:endonuclease/exonuclease/phosphatase (EEP) superfamily protein YafD